MARPHIEPFVDRDVPFKKMTLPGFPKGMQYKMLSLDPDNGACTMTVLFEPGYKQPPGMSYTEYELFIMTGSITVGDKVHGPGQLLLRAGRRGDRGADLVARRHRPAVLQLRRAVVRRVGVEPPAGRGRPLRRGQRLRRHALDVDELLPGHRAGLLRQDPALRAAHAGVHVPVLHDAELLAGQHLLPRLRRRGVPHLGHVLDDAVRRACRPAAISTVRPTSTTAPSAASSARWPSAAPTASCTTTSTSIRGRTSKRTGSVRPAA